MDITIYTNGYSVKVDDDRKSGCAIVLSTSDQYNRVANREIGVATNNMTKAQAELNAIRIALLSIKRIYESTADIVLYCSANILKQYLNNGGAKHQEICAEINVLKEKFKSVHIKKFIPSDKNVDVCKELAKKCAEDQLDYDSYTRVELNQ